MRNLEVIEKELTGAREELAHIEGRPAEVYSRIVGYYRSVRNWNKGKREEYGERKLYSPGHFDQCADEAVPASAENARPVVKPFPVRPSGAERTLLFTRASCPACPAAKTAAGKLGIAVEAVDTDTEAGLAEAGRWGVMSTPTAILLDAAGAELCRAHDGPGIAAFTARIAEDALPQAASM
jgi:ribonucleoside-triphosphate reductase